MTQTIAVIDLGFGDSGKGRTVDALTRRQRAHSVVRFNGGAQAAHHVVLADGRQHCFSQWGSGTLAGAATVLAAPVVVHPGGLAQEAAALQRLGINDPWSLLQIDARCRVTTPFLQAVGRLREWARAAAAHGSCGVGFGETVDWSLRQPASSLCWSDLRQPALAFHRLREQQRLLRQEADDWRQLLEPAAQAELALLADADVAERWLQQACAIAACSPPRRIDELAESLARSGAVIFEGAQGLLLDAAWGFHPHTTWSDATPDAARRVAAELGLTAPLRCLGLLRSYLSRHGNGPLPTEDTELDPCLPEPHNSDAAWSGRFRRGHPDGLLLRYALEVAGPLDGLALGHVDGLSRASIRWCSAYNTPQGMLDRLPLPADLHEQQALTELLTHSQPIFESDAIRDLSDWVQQAGALGAPPLLAWADGATAADMHWSD